MNAYITAKKHVSGGFGLWVWSVLPPAISSALSHHGKADSRTGAEEAADNYIQKAYGRRYCHVNL